MQNSKNVFPLQQWKTNTHSIELYIFRINKILHIKEFKKLSFPFAEKILPLDS